jgi:hypothetical protein
MSIHLKAIEIQPLERCSECGNFKGLDRGFNRRVDLLMIDPSRSKTFSYSTEEAFPFCVEEYNEQMADKFGDESLRRVDKSPAGLYPAVIVPKTLTGHLIRIIPINEEDAKNDRDRKNRKGDQP